MEEGVGESPRSVKAVHSEVQSNRRDKPCLYKVENKNQLPPNCPPYIYICAIACMHVDIHTHTQFPLNTSCPPTLNTWVHINAEQIIIKFKILARCILVKDLGFNHVFSLFHQIYLIIFKESNTRENICLCWA